jgi:hypothetical protein
VEVSGSIACPFGSPWDPVITLDEIREIVDAYLAVGVTEISISDAPGMAMPLQVYQLMDAGHRLEELMGHPGDSYVLRAGTNEDIRLKMPDR